MKTSLVLRLLAALCLSLAPTILSAQRVDIVRDPLKFTKSDIGAVVTADGVPVLVPHTPRVKIPRNWNDKDAVLRLTVENTLRATLQIEGIQTSGSLYAVSFPKKIGVGEKGELEVRYAAGTAGGGTIDAIHLLTNQGVKTIEVEHDREQVFVLDVTQLQWKAGESGAKTAWLVVDNTASKPAAVRVLGNPKAKAELKQSTDTSYAIVVTPGTQPGKFVVKVDFDPRVEGQTAVIYCEIAN